MEFCAYTEGIWYDDNKLEIPINSFQDNRFIVEKLNWIGLHIQPKRNIFKKTIFCRICYKLLENKYCVVSKDNISWKYPMNIIHYFQEHSVVPSDSFYTFIENYFYL